jgi:hypothetical protein
MSTAGKFDLPQGTLDLLHEGCCARPHSRLCDRTKNSTDVPRGFAGAAGIALSGLHRLEYKKFLKAEWKVSGNGREAKVYELTAQGHAPLKAETENRSRLTDVVALISKGTLEGIS